ncbi:alkaline phosphatase family protein [Bifidobacterium choloepi]|uniref:Alkaline phosphatase family protein n=1 Tax=Bifidobacterium choloepi TaxID=2614131 RepID=A0A6I5N1V7_9BIFI|nr:nucleotide pyrophosphatase/phosphodiesterase family protein [Bifidobacterium choloepi]NEG70145.1 alkaline phosphatase family protein [Bifidobacterium choloepi]
MIIEMPEVETLLSFVPTAQYGDRIDPERPSDVPGRLPAATTAPRGGALHLSSVLPAVSSAIGAPVTTAVHRDPAALQSVLGLPDAGNGAAIVVLVDGLGYWNLVDRLGHAPYLRSLMNDSSNRRPISTCSPSTTVAAMATFGTGTCPGLTGMTGYTQLNPTTDAICQLIQFRGAPDPADLQRQPTVFEQLDSLGVRATSVGLMKFARSPLTTAALRGARYIADERPMQRVKKAAESARQPGLTYLYLRDTDKVGHAEGWLSEKWVAAFEKTDAQLAALRRLAPKGTLIVIVADHGMVMTDPAARIDIAAEPELMRGVRLVGGEPRCVALYAEEDESADEIAHRWKRRLGTRAWVRTKEEIVASGFYGPMLHRTAEVVGDVVVCAGIDDEAAGRPGADGTPGNGVVTIVDSRTQTEQAMALPSVHGSQTMTEMDIPCLVDMA